MRTTSAKPDRPLRQSSGGDNPNGYDDHQDNDGGDKPSDDGGIYV
ncbi:hypothetical protein ACE2AJ_00515 [Aquihabitans daechungensis]